MLYDIVIENGTIVDPKRGKTTVCHLGIKAGKIAALTREKLNGKQIISGEGCIVCPGFIDIHAHVEGNKDCARILAAMGVTTVYNGNCGMGVGDLKGFFNQYEKDGFIINQIEQVGHTTLREAVGLVDRYQAASDEQIQEMISLLENAFKEGAYGLSFGLEYVPGASKEEVIKLSQIAARYDKLVSIHTRSDGYAGLVSLREAIEITKITGSRLQISHLVYQFGMGMLKEALRMIDNALKEGLDITVDSGVYSHFATAIGSAVYDEGCLEKWGCDYSSLIVATGVYKGQRLTKQMYREMREHTPEETVIGMVGKEYEVFQALEKSYMMVSTDAGTLYDGNTPGHPQDAGTYPRFFRTMVREQNKLTWLEAIKRCTYLPASRLGLKHKGCIEIGADADLVMFDPNSIEDRAQYPGFGIVDSKPEGIHYVIVDGIVVVRGKEVLEEKPGKMIKGKFELFEWE